MSARTPLPAQGTPAIGADAAPPLDPAWASATRILVSRLDNLGDVLLATPAIRAIRETLPQARITLHTSPAGQCIAGLDPDVDDVLAYQAPWMDPDRRLPLDAEREAREIARLRAGRFDGAIIFTSYHESPLPAAYMYYLAGIPLRHAASIDGAGSLLTSRHRHPPALVHEVERGLALVGSLGFRSRSDRLVLETRPEDRESAAGILSSVGLGGPGPLVVVHPGSTQPTRTYPAGLYARIADLLFERLGARVVLTGTAGEAGLVEGIRRGSRRAVSLAGRTTLGELAALVERADLVVTNNTGPMHVAAAVGTPVVALFALTNPPEQWGPWRVPHRLLYHPVPCAICYARTCPYGHECLALVAPEQAVAAAADLLTEVGK